MAVQVPQEVVSFVIGKAGKSVDGGLAQPFDGVVVLTEQCLCNADAVLDVMRVGE